VVLYELLAGRTPFAGGDLPQLVYAIVNERPQPLRASRPEIPDGLEVAVFRAMARDRDARFLSVADLAVALAPFAPPAARGSVDRICGIPRDGHRAAADDRTTGARRAASLGSGPLAAALGASPAGPPTITGLGGTQAPPVRARWQEAVLAGLGVVLIVVASFATVGPEHPSAPTVRPMTTEVESPLVTLPPRAEKAPLLRATASAAASDAGPAPAAASVAPRRNQALGVPPAGAPKNAPPKSDPFKRDVF
ncbi:MAG: hypothetical protein FWD17_11015, partial [Polyangiaceae bacterium]|nr:hypothetical protein [Polyangiaceae bacterium]